MRLRFEIKKILLSPLYWLLLACMMLLAYLPLSQADNNRQAYIDSYQQDLSLLSGVLADIPLDEGTDQARRMTGLKSDIETIKKALEQGRLDSIPNYRRLIYQDLEWFLGQYPQVFQTRQSLTRGEIERQERWNDWLLTYQLPDDPENKAWSTGRSVQDFLERLFTFLPFLLVAGFFLAGQVTEKVAAHQRWQLLQWDSLALQGMRRLTAGLLSVMLAVGLGLGTILTHDALIGRFSLESFWSPVEMFEQSQLVPVWLYSLLLFGFWCLLLLGLRLVWAILDHLIANPLVFIVTGGFIGLVLSYQTAAEQDWVGQLLPLLSFPAFVDQYPQSHLFLQVNLLLLVLLALFVAFCLVSEKKRLVLTSGQEKDLETGNLDRPWSFDCLQLSRLNRWKQLLLGNLLLALLFSLFIGIQKQEIGREEGERLELTASYYEQDSLFEEAMQEQINSLRRLVMEDSSYQEELNQKVEILQEYRVYKELYQRQWEVYQTDQQALAASHLDMLKAEKQYLWDKEEAIFGDGNVGGSQTVSNLRRYQTRNQLSQYYWENLIRAGVPATKRGSALILESLENRFETNDATLPVDDQTWDRSRDLSAIGSLRTLFDGPYYLILLLLAVWIGSRGKAVEVAGKHWTFYQTQPVNLKKVLWVKWGLGLLLALGFTFLFFVLLFLLNGLVGGWGYLHDGIILLSYSEKGIPLDLLTKEELWAWFMPNSVYLSWMIFGLLFLEILLLTLHHLLQTRISDRLLVFFLLVGSLFLLNYLVFQGLVLDGQEILRQLALLFSR